MNKIFKILSILGPGWIVMMADIDAPSVFTAIVSGSIFGLSLFWLLLLLIIPLYFVQETSARLSIVTGKGLGRLIKENYGNFSSFVSIGTMVIINSIGFVGEFAGIASGGLIFHIPIWVSVTLAAILHTFVVLRGSYKKVESILIYISAIILTFLISAMFSRPSLEVLKTMVNIPIFNKEYLILILGNIGAVIMPWMIFYQGNAIVDSNIQIEKMGDERKETLIGSVMSEIIMIAIMFTSASLFFGKIDKKTDILSLSGIFSPYAGTLSPYLFAVGIIGAGLLSGIVISLSSSWSIGDYFGIPNSLNLKLSKARVFYIFYMVEIIPAAIITAFFPDLINLMINSMVLNTVLLPIPLYFLIKLSSRENILGKYRNDKYRKGILWTTFFMIIFIVIFTLFNFIWAF
ncbi:MAG: divalent metal cation transporter [Thermoplasmata archaeon]|nr:divalent metal cation transporter [Thermoplasmata archaeon]